MELVKQPNDESYVATVDISDFSDHVRTLGGRNCDTFKPGLWATNTFEAARIDTICFVQELDGAYGEPLFIEVNSQNDTEPNYFLQLLIFWILDIEIFLVCSISGCILMMQSLRGDKIKAKFAHIDFTNSYVMKERVYLK